MKKTSLYVITLLRKLWTSIRDGERAYYETEDARFNK